MRGYYSPGGVTMAEETKEKPKEAPKEEAEVKETPKEAKEEVKEAPKKEAEVKETPKEEAPKEEVKKEAPKKPTASPEEITEKVLEAIEVAKNTGKVKKGTNEATKALERGTAKLVAYAKDVQPQEIIIHLPLLAKEKGIPCAEIPSKEELGTAAGISVPTGAVAIIAEGDAKKIIAELKDQL